MKMSTELLKIKEHLEAALRLSQDWQTKVQNEEGDSDLYRKLAFYLTPSLQHWITGAQAGNIEDLNGLLTKRSEKK